MNRRLRFRKSKIEINGFPTYQVYNKETGVYIINIEKVRVGAYLHWCEVIRPECYDPDYMTFISPGCQDEIRLFCKNPEKFLEGGKND